MNCPRCTQGIPADASYCPHCGLDLSTVQREPAVPADLPPLPDEPILDGGADAEPDVATDPGSVWPRPAAPAMRDRYFIPPSPDNLDPRAKSTKAAGLRGCHPLPGGADALLTPGGPKHSRLGGGARLTESSRPNRAPSPDHTGIRCNHMLSVKNSRVRTGWNWQVF